MQRSNKSPGQRGLSLVELMVAMTIGLFIIAVASALLVRQLRENRSLLLEARLMQDLRTAADLITRDLRRDGFWGKASTSAWTRGSSLHLASNPYAASAPGAAASDSIALRYSRDVVENDIVDTNEVFGYRLRSGVIELQLGAGNWQALTDSVTLTVTRFSVTPSTQDIALEDACMTTCAAGRTDCPPHQQVRSLAVLITGQSVTDPSVVRSLRSEVRLRNDAVNGICPKA